ncbi:MAG: LPP20 family lipoprotein [Deltaproteobacteria bacterium]|nr:LPP20 family lipoprotein [Deltaproteobacteria bacterium]
MVTRSFVLLCLLAPALLSCAGTHYAAPPAASVPQPPSWYLEPPRDSHMALFGVGAGANLPGAKSAALADIGAKLAVSVRAKYVEHTVWRDQVLDERIENDLELRVRDRTFRGYEVLETDLAGEAFYALVKVDRERLFRDSRADYEGLEQELGARLGPAAQRSALEYYSAYRAARPDLERASESLLLLKAVDPGFDISPEAARQRAYRDRYEEARRRLVFTLVPDEASHGLGRVIQELLSQEGFLAEFGSESACSAICVEISSSESSRYAARRYMSTVQAVFRVREPSGAVAVMRQHEVRGTALTGYPEANRAAMRNFQAGCERQGILSVLGL